MEDKTKEQAPLEQQDLQQPENDPDKNAQLQQQLAELQDKYLRQMAEFNNYKQRVARERIELNKLAGKDMVMALLPVLDDFERAIKSDNVDIEGISLIYNKLKNNLEHRGITPMQAVGQPFNPDFHEAITEIPAPSDELKGKVIDEVEKGYYMQDAIIRYAKVIVGK